MENASVNRIGTSPKEIMSIKYVQEGPASPNAVTHGTYTADLGFSNSFAWRNSSSAQTWNSLMDYSFTPYPVGNDKFAIVTSSRVDIVDAVDAVLHNAHPEYHMENFMRWRAATEPHLLQNVPKGGIVYVKTPEFNGFITDFHERQADNIADPVFGKFVTDIIEYQGPINRVGEMFSRKETLRQAWLEYKESIEGQELAYQKGAGEEISYLGIDPRESVVSAIGRYSDDKIVLLNGLNNHDHISDLAEAYRLSHEDVAKVVFMEEDNHRLRNSYDQPLGLTEQRLAEEVATKTELWQLYDSLYEGTSNEELRIKYSKIKEMIAHDIATIDRYKELYTSEDSLDSIVMALRQEAYAKGLRSEGEIEEYVSSRMPETVYDSEDRGTLETIISSDKVVYKASNDNRSEGTDKNGKAVSGKYVASSKNYNAANDNSLEAVADQDIGEEYDSVTESVESSEYKDNDIDYDGLMSEVISDEMPDEVADNDDGSDGGDVSDVA